MKTSRLLCQLFLIMITFILTSCEKSENAPSIEGVKISGYSWELKQAFQNKGFIVAKKEKNGFVMKNNNQGDIGFSLITVITGHNKKVLLANQTFMGIHLDEKFIELENEYNTYYGEPSYSVDSDTLKIRNWIKYENGKIVAEIELTGTISSRETDIMTPSFEIISPITGTPMTIGTTKPFIITNMTTIKLVALNHQNIKKYAEKQYQ